MAVPLFVALVHAAAVHTHISYHHILLLHHTSLDAVHVNVGFNVFTLPLSDGVLNVGALGPALSYVHVLFVAAVLLFHARSVTFHAGNATVTVPFHVVLLFTVHTATVLDTTLKL